MVAIGAIREANKNLSDRSFTAVFVGATSGIGLGAIKALLQNTEASKVFIVGRSQHKFESTLAHLRTLNPAANLVFIEAQVSALHEVHQACSLIKQQHPDAIDLLWLSQGGLSLAGYQLTPEGLNSDLAVKYYSRMLFMHELIPLLDKAADPRVVSVLSAASEGKVQTSDFGIEKPENHGFVSESVSSVQIWDRVGTAYFETPVNFRVLGISFEEMSLVAVTHWGRIASPREFLPWQFEPLF